MIKIKRNPYEQDLAKDLLKESYYYEFLAEGNNGEVYYFILNKDTKIKHVNLKKGKYILKINWDLSSNIEQLIELSDLKLIPKIYYADEKISIMSYFEGVTFDKILEDYEKYPLEKIMKNIIHEFHKWKKAKASHGDIHEGNILVNKKGNVIFIDPDYNNFYDYDNIDFSGLILSHLNLSDLDFRNIDLDCCDLSYSNFYNSNLYNVNLSESDLTGADLSYSDLSNADLSYCVLYKTDFTKAIINENTSFTEAKDIEHTIGLNLKNPRASKIKKQKCKILK